MKQKSESLHDAHFNTAEHEIVCGLKAKELKRNSFSTRAKGNHAWTRRAKACIMLIFSTWLCDTREYSIISTIVKPVSAQVFCVANQLACV